MTRRISFIYLLLTTLFLFAIIGCGSGVTHTFNSGGSSTETGNPIFVDGVIQKGPFYAGTKVYIKELDGNNFEPTGVVHVTEVLNNLGEFEVTDPADIASTYVEISVTGYFYNEITGRRSFFPILLSSFVDITQTKRININMLTTIAMKREKYLMVHGGKTYEAAKIQARNEILTAFRVPEEIIGDLQDGGADTFTTMDIAQDGVKNAILLSLSVILNNYPQVPAWKAIQTIGDDIETDGVIDDSQYIEAFYENSTDLDASQIRTNLDRYYQSLSAWVSLPKFESFLELFTRPYTTAKPPVFSLPSATYNRDITVELYTVTADTDIYYTVNGSTPILYTDPITISGDQTIASINARTVGPNMSDSDTVSAYYFVDYNYDPAQYKMDMTIDQYESNMVGTWVGHVEAPASYLSPDSVMITINDAMQYSAQCISRYYGDPSGLNQAYISWFGSEYYYGTMGFPGTNLITVNSVYADGKATANIDNVDSFGNAINFGSMDPIAISDDLNHMQFALWSIGYTEPFIIELTRLRE